LPALDLRFSTQHLNGATTLGHAGTFGSSSRGFFGELVGLAHNATTGLLRQQERECGGRPACSLGSLHRPNLERLAGLVSQFDSCGASACERPPGDGQASAKRWLASEVLGGNWAQAITLVEFDPTSTSSTLIAYEHSDRFVIVLDGHGLLYTTGATLTEIAKEGFGEIKTHHLEPGVAVLLTRAFVHSFAGGTERALTLLVCHLPYIAPDDERYSTIAKWLSLASMRDIRDVFRDRNMLTVMYLVNQGTRSTVGLCRLMHRGRAEIETVSDRLEAIRMIKRDDAGGWSLHLTVSMCEKDGKIEIAREELGYRVEQRAPRVT
jgi:hypothetical protein